MEASEAEKLKGRRAQVFLVLLMALMIGAPLAVYALRLR